MPAVGQPDLILDPATFAAELQALSSGGYHTITQAQLREIAQQKLVDLNATDLDAAAKIIAGTARSMGVEVSR